MVRLAARPGSFRTLEHQVFVRVASREANGELVDVFIVDQRDSQPQRIFYAKRGLILESDGVPLLQLSDGQIQTRNPDAEVPSLVSFNNYVLHFSTLTSSAQTSSPLRERTTIELVRLLGTERPALSELSRRAIGWLYVLGSATIAVAFVVRPSVNRQRDVIEAN